VGVVVLRRRRRWRTNLVGTGGGAATSAQPGPDAGVARGPPDAVRRVLDRDGRSVLATVSVIATPPRLRATTCKGKERRGEPRVRYLLFA